MTVLEFWLRAATVLVGVSFLLCLPYAMFWPRSRRPYALLLFACIALMTVSALLGIVYAHANGQPVRWYGTPLRLAALLIGWAYIWRARVDWKRQP